MSEQYTISAVSEQTRPYDDKVVYYVKLNEAQADVPSQAFELHQKQTSKAPMAGQTIDVKTFQRGEFKGDQYVKIIKDWDAIKARSQSGGGSSQGGSDERGESIERQVAAKVAGEMAIGTPDKAGLGAVLVISNFEAYFDAVLAKIKGAAQSTLNGGGGEIPADTAGLPAGPMSDDSQITF